MDYAGEKWRPVVGFEGSHEVSDYGRVRRRAGSWPGHRCGLLKPWEGSSFGYLYVGLKTPSARATRAVHGLVLEAFVGPRPIGMECRHLDGDPANDRRPNLAWGTHAENEADKLRHGRSNRGSRHGMAKLTESHVLEMRRLLASGQRLTDVANQYGVSVQAACDIRRGRNWSHLGGELS